MGSNRRRFPGPDVAADSALGMAFLRGGVVGTSMNYCPVALLKALDMAEVETSTHLAISAIGGPIHFHQLDC